MSQNVSWMVTGKNAQEPFEILTLSIAAHYGDEVKERVASFLKQLQPGEDEAGKRVVLRVEDSDLQELLGRHIVHRTRAEICDEKLDALKKTKETSEKLEKACMSLFWSRVCEKTNLPEDKALTLDLPSLVVTVTSRFESIKKEFEVFFRADENKLQELLEKHGQGSFMGDIASEFLGPNSSRAKALFRRILEGDQEFLEEVLSHEDIPKCMRKTAEGVLDALQEKNE